MKNLYDDTIGDFHTVKWFAKKYNYSESLIHHLTKKGLKSYFRGGIKYISEEDFNKYFSK